MGIEQTVPSALAIYARSDGGGGRGSLCQILVAGAYIGVMLGGGVRFCRERRVKYGKEHDYEADEEAGVDVDWMFDDCGFVGVLQLFRSHGG